MPNTFNHTPASIYLRNGNNPILILRFKPFSNPFKKFGPEIVVSIEFTVEEQMVYINQIKNKEFINGEIRFKILSGGEVGNFIYEVSTVDIEEIKSTKS